MKFYYQHGRRRGAKDCSSIADTEGEFIDEDVHPGCVTIHEIEAPDWKAARVFVADTYFV